MISKFTIQPYDCYLVDNKQDVVEVFEREIAESANVGFWPFYIKLAGTRFELFVDVRHLDKQERQKKLNKYKNAVKRAAQKLWNK